MGDSTFLGTTLQQMNSLDLLALCRIYLLMKLVRLSVTELFEKICLRIYLEFVRLTFKIAKYTVSQLYVNISPLFRAKIVHMHSIKVCYLKDFRVFMILVLKMFRSTILRNCVHIYFPTEIIAHVICFCSSIFPKLTTWRDNFVLRDIVGQQNPIEGVTFIREAIVSCTF